MKEVSVKVYIFRIIRVVVIFLITAAISYYFLLLTSNLQHDYSMWNYFILLFFSFFWVFNITIFWMNLRRPAWIKVLCFIILSPIVPAISLLREPVQYYRYYLIPILFQFNKKGTDISTYLQYYKMDRYFSYILYLMIGYGVFRMLVLIFSKKQYR